MNMGNDDEKDDMETMLKIVNNIREINYPIIPQKLVEKILLVEKENLENRDFAYKVVSDMITEELKKFD